MSDGLLIKPWSVSVRGFDSATYYAASRGKALARAWGDYSCSYTQTSFKDFLRIAKVHRTVGGPRFGERITVAGHDAFYISEAGQYVRFARPGGEETFLSHPLDVEPRP